MQARQLLHNLLSKALSNIHSKRLTAVVNATHSLLVGKALTLTQIGRHMSGQAKERHNIRKVDRLLANQSLHQERRQFYQAKAKLLLTARTCIVVSVDWSATDKRKDFHILRASISLKGRSEVIYEEVHEDCCLNNNAIHRQFLEHLKRVLPQQINVIIATDAGFCNPWFKTVRKLGWHFIGRTKGTIQYTLSNQNKWKKCSQLYAKASRKAMWIGECFLAKTNKISCYVVTYKDKLKGRVHCNRSGKKSRNTQSKRMAKRQRTPWVLVTSLDDNRYKAHQIVKLYKTRMQIEENFRDTKSVRYGFSLRHSLSTCPRRIEILLLFAMLATLICWITSLIAMAKNHHYDYQANSVKHQTILSVIYLGCQLVRRQYTVTLQEAINALRQLRGLIKEVVLCN